MKPEAIAALSLSLRDQTERERRLAKPIVDALAKGCWCRAALPAEEGGMGLDPVDLLSAYETLARGEASVAWIAWNNGLVCLFSRFLAPAPRRELFARPEVLFAQSTRPTGVAETTADGYRVSGRWALVSGCELAEWLLLLCQVDPGAGGEAQGGEGEVRFVLLRRREVEIVDTWHVGGLRGTGSHDVVAKDVEVPAAFSLFPGVPPTMTGLWNHLPIIATVSAGFGAQALGLAAGAIDSVATTAAAAISQCEDGSPESAIRPELPHALALHRAALAAARSHLHASLRTLAEQASTAPPVDPHIMGDVYAATSHAVHTAREAVDVMYDLAGTRALYTDSPLERIHRDLRAMLQHVVAQRLWVEDAGRVQLGLPATNPLFAV